MKKKGITLIIGFLSLFWINPSIAQESTESQKPGSALYLEGYGNNMTFSLNYEHYAFSVGKIHTMARIGFGGVPNRYGIPVGLHFLKGKNGKYIDLGLGLSYVNGGQVISGSNRPTVRGEGIFFTPTIGYRRQLSDKGFFFRVNAGLAFKLKEYNEALGGNRSTLPLLGISFGRSF